MNLAFRPELVRHYTSASQRIGNLGEAWVAENLYRPSCGFAQLRQFEKDRRVADFVCSKCAEQFELKSKSGSFGSKVPNGAYETLLQRLRAADNPNLLLLGYHRPSLPVRNLIIVPKQYFHPSASNDGPRFERVQDAKAGSGPTSSCRKFPLLGGYRSFAREPFVREPKCYRHGLRRSSCAGSPRTTARGGCWLQCGSLRSLALQSSPSAISIVGKITSRGYTRQIATSGQSCGSNYNASAITVIWLSRRAADIGGARPRAAPLSRAPQDWTPDPAHARARPMPTRGFAGLPEDSA